MEQFWAKVDKTATCWLYTGYLTKGYGRVMVNSKRYMIHRYVYEKFLGLIPDGLEIDHLCRIRNCVNPDHLEAVTRLVNNYRIPNYQGNRTHCKYGHPLEKREKYGRFCRTCTRKTQREFLRVKRAKMRATCTEEDISSIERY